MELKKALILNFDYECILFLSMDMHMCVYLCKKPRPNSEFVESDERKAENKIHSIHLKVKANNSNFSYKFRGFFCILLRL